MAITISALPETVNLNLYAGDDFTLQLTVLDANGAMVDLTSGTVESQVRATPPGPVLATFDVTVDQPLTGTAVLHLTPDATATLPARAVWDVQVSFNAGANVTTLAAGVVTVTAEVTRDDVAIGVMRAAVVSGAAR